MLLLQSTSNNPGSGVLGLILILAICGAVSDYRYKRAGGRPPSRKDRIFFSVALLLVFGSIGVTEYMGVDPFGILAVTILPLVVWLFAAWEFGRWRMRRRYPLQPKAETAATGK